MQAWTENDARNWIAVPQKADDKYSRGVLGVITGSEAYPGAAVLGVDAAARTGVGKLGGQPAGSSPASMAAASGPPG